MTAPEMANNTVPNIAVVGHPNKGKSSIVASLTRNENVAISNISGTTTESNAYPFTLDGRLLYTLIDTPGFQRPRQVLEWLSNNASHAAQRVDAVKQFVNHHQVTQESDGRFKDEVELLDPIINGAGIIYVVDGSEPYSSEYEAEMTILQWTGMPRMALINPISGEKSQYIEDWKQALGQYFSIVRVFNPMHVDSQKHISILHAYIELDPKHASSLEAAIENIALQTQLRIQYASRAIADYVSEALSFSMRLPMPSENKKPLLKEGLSASYRKKLSDMEKSLRKKLSDQYSFYNLDVEGSELELDYPDLFDQQTWYLFGLSKNKLLSLSLGAGAAMGAVVDAGMLGGSLFLGALTGSMVGGAAAWLLSGEVENIKVSGLPLSTKTISVGPVRNLEFAFVLLGRAIQFQEGIARRAHANRDVMQVQDAEKGKWIDRLDKQAQLRLTRLLKKLADSPSQDLVEQLQILVMEIIPEN